MREASRHFTSKRDTHRALRSHPALQITKKTERFSVFFVQFILGQLLQEQEPPQPQPPSPCS
jgi:hypothetical protein